MLNIVDKYTAEAPSATEDGVVAIEYVLLAAVVAVAVVALGAAFSGPTGLTARLTSVINRVV